MIDLVVNIAMKCTKQNIILFKEGFANSAPDKTNLKIKVIISFLISFIPSYFIYWIVENELLNYDIFVEEEP